MIGAGAVGLEFASLYRSLGAEVTLLEALPGLAPLEDEDVSAEIAKAFRRRGIKASAGASVKEIADTGEAVDVTFEAGGKAEKVSADVCLVAIGRGPVTEGLGLEEAGVSMHDKGFVNVDGQLRTNVGARVGGGRRRGHPAPARPRRVHRGLRRRRADRRRDRARHRLRQHPARHLLHARDRERRPDRAAQAKEPRRERGHRRISTSGRSARRTSSAKGAS